MDCLTCGTPDDLKPMCFRGEPYCSEECRKFANGELTTFPIKTGKITINKKPTTNENSVVE